jgi:DNA-binding winged helix-turn-helix (wHTH) protein
MVFRFDEFELDADDLELRRNGVPVKADRMALRVLRDLVTHAGRLVSKEQLIANVWGGRAVSENVITVAVARLRKTLGREKGGREFVLSVHGQGYRFVRSVEARVASRPPPPLRAPMLRGMPFVGRERVLDRLRMALDQVQRGSGSVCLLVGEPGIGKTSAAEVMEAEAAEAGVRVVWGYCRESGDTPPLWPFIQLVRGAVEGGSVDLAEPRLSTALGELLEVLPELTPLVSPADGRDSRTTSPTTAPTRTHRLLDAIIRTLSLVAEQSPCMLVLDDLHRADTASLEVLRHFVGEIARTRVLVVGTLRKGVVPEPPGDRHLAHVLGHRNTTRLTLERLDESDVRAYTSAAVGADDALARAVYLRSEGNPFFMVEFARTLPRNASSSSSALAVSEAALDLLRQRVSTLDAAVRGVLSLAAVIGNQFDLPLLEDVSGMSLQELMTSLDRAVASDVLVAVGDSRTRFRFVHDLLRAVLYDDLDRASLRSFHLRVQGALERRSLSGYGVQPADLAYHAHSAIPEGDPRRVVGYCRDAAAAAAERRAYGDAVRYTRHAREALELVPRPSARLRLALVLQQALYARSCSSPEFESAVREGIRLARAQNAPAALAWAALMLDLHPGFPALPGARATLTEARDCLSPEDDALPAVLARLASSAPTAYDVDRASAELDRAVELSARSQGILSANTVGNAELFLLGGPRHRDRAAVVLRELEELCERNPETLSVTPVLLDLHRAIASAQAGAEPLVSAALERASRRCREIAHYELGWHVERFRLLSRINAGQRELVAAELRQHHRRAEAESLFGTDLFIAYDEIVALGAGSKWMPERGADVLAPQADDLPSIWALKIRALAATGRHEEARRSLRRISPSALERLPCDRDHLGTLGALARAVLALGEVDYFPMLERLLSPHRDHFAINLSFYSEGSVPELLEALAAARSARADPAAPLEGGVRRRERTGLVA